MKLPYSYVKKIYDLKVDLNSCVLYAYETRNGLHPKNLYYDNKLTTPLSYPVKLIETRLHDVNLDNKPYRLQIRDDLNNIVSDLSHIYGVDDSSGGGVPSNVGESVTFGLKLTSNTYNVSRYYITDESPRVENGLHSGESYSHLDVDSISCPFSVDSITLFLSFDGVGVSSTIVQSNALVNILLLKKTTIGVSTVLDVDVTVSGVIGGFVVGSGKSTFSLREDVNLIEGDELYLCFNPNKTSYAINNAVKYLGKSKAMIILHKAQI